MVFQIVDDVLDLTATDEQLGKPAGHDLEEGVYTLPVTRTLSNGRSSGDELRDILGKPLEPVERDKALAIVRSDDGIESAITTAQVYAEARATRLRRLGARPGRRRAAGGAVGAAADGRHRLLTRQASGATLVIAAPIR